MLSVSRQLVVQDVCLAGDVLCQGRCIGLDELCGGSSGLGVGLSSAATSTSSGVGSSTSSSSSSGSSGSSSSSSTVLVAATYVAPTVSLITTAQFGSTVEVRGGWGAALLR